MTTAKTFAYGTFSTSQIANTNLLIGATLGFSSTPTIALEVLREFSATEFIARVHVVGRGGNWTPVSQPAVREYSWYRDFTKMKLYFLTEGSKPWQVLFFRQESDESGPYVAAGLKLLE